MAEKPKDKIISASDDLYNALGLMMSAKVKLASVNHISVKDVEKVRSKLNLLVKRLRQ